MRDSARPARPAASPGGAIRWLTVFLDFPASGFERGVAFWREVTGYGLSAARGAHGEFATLLPPSGDAYLRVQRLRDGPGGCHLDLHIDPASASLDEVAARAVALGATVRHRAGDGELIVVDSPGGLAFCLVGWDGETVVPGPRAADGAATRVDTLCLDVAPEGVDREVGFWSALTGQGTVPARVPGFTYLAEPAHPSGRLPVRLLLQRLDSGTPGQRARAHVDLGCAGKPAIGQHVALGARVAGTFAHWTVLTDPAGREYCLVSRDPG